MMSEEETVDLGVKIENIPRSSRLSRLKPSSVSSLISMKKAKKMLARLLIQRRTVLRDGAPRTGIGEASVLHALIVIFLEFFAWGLLTIPGINLLNKTFPDHAFLMNGLIVGIKGFLSFLAAPLIGALSDIWGRKFFLLLTVFFTCLPIPFMALSPVWYFAVFSISGTFAVTFSVIFAFVADITNESERSAAYGLVSATFAASLVLSPAFGAYISEWYGDWYVIYFATSVAVLDVLFILLLVPESLPEKYRAHGDILNWERVSPFKSLVQVTGDKTILLLSLAVFLSYLPEAGQYSCIFVYLRLVIGFTAEEVAIFLAVIGLLSVLSQTIIMAVFMRSYGSKITIILGMVFQYIQLTWYGYASAHWAMYAAGILAALSSITYPSISSHLSSYASQDKQGLSQGVITGVRGLCNGIGPALYGLIFWYFKIDLDDKKLGDNKIIAISAKSNFTLSGKLPDLHVQPSYDNSFPGPPFMLGSILVLVAIAVTYFLPSNDEIYTRRRSALSRYSSINEDMSTAGIDRSNGSFDNLSKHSRVASLISQDLVFDDLDTQAGDVLENEVLFDKRDEVNAPLIVSRR